MPLAFNKRFTLYNISKSLILGFLLASMSSYTLAELGESEKDELIFGFIKLIDMAA
ncbi:MAG: hypothetical protein JKX81_07735 [Arenicella sp.]|nr:hypothetical protein [Arenicella sp.]